MGSSSSASYEVGIFGEIAEEHFDRTFDTNVRGVLPEDGLLVLLLLNLHRRAEARRCTTDNYEVAPRHRALALDDSADRPDGVDDGGSGWVRREGGERLHRSGA